MDRVINYTNGNITLEKTSQILNILDTDTYIELSDFILKAELNNAILGFNEISDKGFGEKDFLEGLVEHFRNLIVVKASNTQSLIDDENNFEKVIEQSKLAEQNKLINAIEILEGSIINLSKFENKKLVVEISLMKICKMSESSNISEKKKVENTNSIPTINPEKNSFKQNSIYEEKFQKSELLKKSSAENVKKVENISALSLSSLKLKKQAREEKDLIESEKKKSSDIFNLNSLRDKIKKYSKKINDLGKKSLSSLLEMNEPTLEENSITFTLPSKISLIEFEKEREAFTIFLQKELNNYNIKVLSKVEEKKNGDYFSSPTEKLTKLIEINPLVGKFKEDLKLDL